MRVVIYGLRGKVHFTWYCLKLISDNIRTWFKVVAYFPFFPILVPAMIDADRPFNVVITGANRWAASVCFVLN